MQARVVALLTILGGCTCNTPGKPGSGAGSAGPSAARAAGSEGGGRTTGAGSAAGASAGAGAAAGSACTTETATRVSQILTEPAHPCRSWVLASYGRMVRIVGEPGGASAGGASGSGVIVSTAAARGAGLLVTCGPCAGAADAGARRLEGGIWMSDPGREPTRALGIGAPARLEGGAVAGGPPRYAARALIGADDFALAAITGARGDEGATAGAAASGALALEDPRRLAAARAPFVDVRPGAAVLILGFPRVAGAADGELVASVGRVLADGDARARLGGAYDPRAELAIAGPAPPGAQGGGVFDEGGRLVGVVARAAASGGGADVVRAVRATSIAARLSAALGAAPVAARAKVLPFLP